MPKTAIGYWRIRRGEKAYVSGLERGEIMEIQRHEFDPLTAREG